MGTRRQSSVLTFPDWVSPPREGTVKPPRHVTHVRDEHSISAGDTLCGWGPTVFSSTISYNHFAIAMFPLQQSLGCRDPGACAGTARKNLPRLLHRLAQTPQNTVVKTFFPHQKDAFVYASARSRIALFMEMRLGKSLVAIRWAKSLGTVRRILLLAPLGTIPDWCEELREEGEFFLDLTGLSPSDRVETGRLNLFPVKPRTWHILNYESFRSTPAFWNELPWDCVIGDESSIFRNPRAQITKLMMASFAGVDYRAALTGTPNPEGPMDYYCQLAFLHGGFCGFWGKQGYWMFREKMFRPDYMGYNWIPKSGTRERIKVELDRETFQLTRKQAKIGPKKVYERRVIPPNVEQIRLNGSIEKKFAVDDLETQWATVQHVWLARVAGGFHPDRERPENISAGKTQEILSLLAGDLKKQSVLIWFYFIEELKHVEDVLKKKKYAVGTIYGDVSKDERQVIRRQFDREDIQILLMQVRTGRFGMNLSKADTAIYYSNSYALEDRVQSEDRIVHVRKTWPQLYIDLVTKDTVDEDVLSALRSKARTSAEFRSRLLENIRRRFDKIKVVRPGD